MTLKTTSSVLPDICSTNIPESQTLIVFTLWRGVFELQAIFRQVHRRTRNDLQRYKVKGTQYMSN